MTVRSCGSSSTYVPQVFVLLSWRVLKTPAFERGLVKVRPILAWLLGPDLTTRRSQPEINQFWLLPQSQRPVEMWWHTRRKPYFVFRRNGRFHLNRRVRHFSRLLAAEVSASTVVMLDTPCSEVVWRVLATHCIRQFPPHFPSRASLCAITFQLQSNACTHLSTGSWRQNAKNPAGNKAVLTLSSVV